MRAFMMGTVACACVAVSTTRRAQEVDPDIRSPFKFTCDVVCGNTVQSFSGTDPNSCDEARYESGVDDFIATCMANGEFPMITNEQCVDEGRGLMPSKRAAAINRAKAVTGVDRYRFAYRRNASFYIVILTEENQQLADDKLHEYFGLDMGGIDEEPNAQKISDAGADTGFLATRITTAGKKIREYIYWHKEKGEAVSGVGGAGGQVYTQACSEARYARMVKSDMKTSGQHKSERHSNGRSKQGPEIEKAKANRRAQKDADSRNRRR